MRKTLSLLCFLISASLVLATEKSTGKISGKLYDNSNGDALIGASIRLGGTDKVAFAEINGEYTFSEIQPGSYELVAAMNGFTTTTVKGVVVVAGEITKIDVQLHMAAFNTEMVVIAELSDETEDGLLQHRKNADAISDAISGELISRSGGGNAADAVARITGASVVGNKYLFIRGLGDRYTSTHLNGVEMPTSDPDTNSFQADLFPASILENIVAIKSFTPDKPGNFSGGIVDIGTRTYPSVPTMEVSVSGGYDSRTTGEGGFLYYPGGSGDWKGSDDGLRSLPDGFDDPHFSTPSLITARGDQASAELLDRVTKSFTPVMGHSTRKAPENKGMSVSYGNLSHVFGHKLGYIATFSYKRAFDSIYGKQTQRWKLTESNGAAESLINQSSFVGDQGTETASWGGMAGLGYHISSNHQVGFNTLFSQSGESRSNYYSGSWPDQFSSDNAGLESRLLKYTERNLSSYQLRGQHYLPDFLGMTIDWNASVSDTYQDEPDTRIFTNTRSLRLSDGVEAYRYSITSSTYSNPARYWRTLNEDAQNFKINAGIPIELREGLVGRLLFGISSQKKTRDFREVRFEYQSESNTRFDDFAGDPAAFFGTENLGILGYDEQRNRYTFGNVLVLSPDSRGGNYDGEEHIDAFFGMLETPVSQHLRLIVGARYEKAKMEVTNGDDVGRLDDGDVLPSLNLIYEIGAKANLRFSYGRTLARPNFREKAPYASYDFIADGIYVGNPDLEHTLIDNLDIRWEWFGTPGEVIAISGFYKIFENPIERAFNVRTTSEFGERTYLNVPEATVYGLEAEFRKRFSQVENDHQFSLGANVSLIKSQVDIPEEEYAFILQRDPVASPTRELQGQSPYLVNLSTNYDNYEIGTAISIYYNVFGKRLDEVGVGAAPNAYEQSQNMVDFSFSQKFARNLSVKLTAKNLLDERIEITQVFKGNAYIRSSHRSGRNFSLSLSYKP